jgi:hypothetical protein
MENPMTRIPQAAYIRLVRASAWYDVALTALLATPWTFSFFHQVSSGLNQSLGGAPLPAFGPFQTMIASMMGTVVLLWSVLRLVEPTVRLGRFDGTGRFLFASWMAWALLHTGAPILRFLVVPELAWGVLQWWPVSGKAVLRSVCGSPAVKQP